MKRFLCFATVLFIFAGCSNNLSTSNQSPVLDTEQAEQLVLASEFWERFYSGIYFIQSDDDETVVENSMIYKKFVVMYEEIPSEQIMAVGIDFGEIMSNYKIGTYVMFPFNSLDNMKSEVEHTFTKNYAQQNLYSIYDEIYFQNENSVLCSFGISAMFPYTPDFSTLTLTNIAEDSAAISIECGSTYDTEPIKVCYTVVSDNGIWKISEKKYCKEETIK